MTACYRHTRFLLLLCLAVVTGSLVGPEASADVRTRARRIRTLPDPTQPPMIEIETGAAQSATPGSDVEITLGVDFRGVQQKKTLYSTVYVAQISAGGSWTPGSTEIESISIRITPYQRLSSTPNRVFGWEVSALPIDVSRDLPINTEINARITALKIGGGVQLAKADSGSLVLAAAVAVEALGYQFSRYTHQDASFHGIPAAISAEVNLSGEISEHWALAGYLGGSVGAAAGWDANGFNVMRDSETYLGFEANYRDFIGLFLIGSHAGLSDDRADRWVSVYQVLAGLKITVD